MRRPHHLHDDRLVDCYLAARHGAPLDPPIAEHLADCETCGARYVEIVRFMDGVREEGEAEADATFTPERLRAQRLRIERRVAHIGHAARVISFPPRVINGSMTASGSPAAPRWIAGAAAAGLFLGLAVGASYRWDDRARAGRSVNAVPETAAPILLAPASAAGDQAPVAAADDVFLSELEIVLDRPRNSELQPLDMLTPHVRDIRDIRDLR